MSENKMMVADALSRIDSVLDAEPVSVSGRPEHPKDSSVTLKDVAFTAKQGEVTALVGPSGGGKTTVSRLVAR